MHTTVDNMQPDINRAEVNALPAEWKELKMILVWDPEEMVQWDLTAPSLIRLTWTFCTEPFALM